MEFNKTLTIAIPVYEKYVFFEEAINSALNQKEKCEVLVIDNCSSHEKFQNFVNDLNLPYVHYYRNDSNVGMVENWNQCIRHCNTEWVTILHDDDWLHPDFTTEFSKLRNSYPKAGCFCVNVSVQKDAKGLSNPGSDKRTNKIKRSAFLFGPISPFPGVIFKTSLAREINGFNKETHPVSDYDFWIRLQKKADIIKTNKRLAIYRVSPMQGSKTEYISIIEKSFELRKSLLKSRSPFLKFLSYYNLFTLFVFYKKTYQVKGAVTFRIPKINTLFHIFERIHKVQLLNKIILKTTYFLR